MVRHQATVILFLLCLCAAQVRLQRRNVSVIVVLPPGLQSNKSNALSITVSEDAEAHVKVNDGSMLLRYVTTGIWAGKPTNISVGPVGASLSSYILRVDVFSAVKGGLLYSRTAHLPRITDIFEVHLETEKDFYRPMEIVRFRILPLTSDYQMSASPFTILIQNPNDLVVWKETFTATADNPYVRSSFRLPKHLAEGRWKITVRDASLDGLASLAEKSFEVMLYELPKFEVVTISNATYYATGREDVEILAYARLATGRPVSGILTLSCWSSSQPSNTIRTLQIEYGNVTLSFNLKQCWSSSGSAPNDISIRVEVRDHGSGDKHSTTLKIPLQVKPYSIRLLPLKPGLTYGRVDGNLTAPFLVTVVQPGREPAGRVPIRATVECIQQLNRITYLHANETIGSTNDNGELLISVKLPARQKCLGLLTEVSTYDSRLAELQHSSARLFLPLLIPDAAAVTSMEKLQFQIGDVIPIRILRSSSSISGAALRILAVSQSNTISHLPVTGDIVRLPVISGMVPEFMLILYHINNQSSVAALDDVIRILVSYGCDRDKTVLMLADPSQPFVSQSLFQPGSHATLVLEGRQGTFVATKVIDKKLEQLARQFQFLEQNTIGVRRKGDILEKLFDDNNTLDGFDLAPKRNGALDACCAAGRVWWQKKTDLECANLKTALPYLADCHSKFTSCCKETELPKSSRACQNGQTNCIGMAGAGFNTRMHFPVNSHFAKVRPVQEEDSQPELNIIRRHFPEVWLFNQYSLGTSSVLTKSVTLPHSITNWTLIGRFWSPTYPICQVQTEIGIDMSTYMEVELPSTVYVGDQMLVKVVIYNFEASQKKVMFNATKPRGLCSSGPSMGWHLSLNASSSTAVTIPFEFLRSDRYEIIFTLTEFLGHSRQKQLDQVVKEVYAMARETIDSSLEYNFSWDLGAGDNVDKWINDTILAYNFIRFKDEESAEINASVYLTDVAISNIQINKLIAQFTPLPAAKRARWSKLKLANDTWRDFVTASSLNEVLIRAPSILQAVEDSKESAQAIPNKALVQSNQLLHLCQMETLSFRTRTGAYSQFRLKDPAVDEEARGSVWLTVMATALNCRTNMDVSVVCPSLRWLTEQQNKDGSFTSTDSSEFTTLKNQTENSVMVTSFTLLTMRVCANYGNKCSKYWIDEGPKRSAVRNALGYLASYDTKKTDPLVLGSLALAFAAWKHPFARPENDALLKLLEEGSDYPYWTYRRQTNGWWDKVKHGAKGWFSAEYRNKMLSCQIALNSMGLITQLILGNPKKLNLEQIGLWLIEHRKRDGVFVRTLDTILASRAIVELQRSLVERDSNVVTRISVHCENAGNCPSLTITPQNAELTQTLDLSVDSRGVTFMVTGRGAVYVKFQLIGSPPVRNSDYYPLQLNANTSAQGTNSFVHDLCFQSTIEAIKSFSIEHTYGSGLSYVAGSFNTTKGTLTSFPVEPTSHSLHIVFADVKTKTEYCYTFQTVKSQTGVFSLRRPIVAKHATLGIVGLTLSAGQNQGTQVPLLEKYCPANSNECICAEAACPPPQAECNTDMCSTSHVKNLVKALCNVNYTGCVVKLIDQEEETAGSTVYTRYITRKHFALYPNSAESDCKDLDILIRRSCPCPHFLQNDYYVLVVRRDALLEPNIKGFRPTVLVGEHGFFEPYFACSDNRQSDVHKLVQETHRLKICANLT